MISSANKSGDFNPVLLRGLSASAILLYQRISDLLLLKLFRL
jgi:hypothetical protein